MSFKTQRIKLKVKATCITESGLSLLSEDGTSYHWFTKNYSSPLWAVTDDWFEISATLFSYNLGGVDFENGLKNVRVLNQNNC